MIQPHMICRRAVWAALISSSALAPVPVLAQSAPTPLERIEALEAEIARRQAELDQVRSDLNALRRDLGARAPTQTATPMQPDAAPAPAEQPAPKPAAVNRAVCHMADTVDYDIAFRKPSGLSGCVPPLAEGQKTPLAGSTGAEALAKATASQVPGRPNPLPGISAALQFSGGGSSKAQVTYSHPVIYRKIGWGKDKDGQDYFWQRPQLLSLSATLGVPATKGENPLLSRTANANRDLDVPGGTTVKFAVDFMSFARQDRSIAYGRMAEFLHKAHKTCMEKRKGGDAVKDSIFFAHYGLTARPQGIGWQYADPRAPEARPDEPPRDERTDRAETSLCRGADLINFVLETKKDPTAISGAAFERPELAATYQALFWEDSKTAIPDWGVGASVEYGTTDFRFRQAQLAIGPNADGRIVALPDLSVPLANERKLTEDDWRMQVYGAYMIRTLDHYAPRSGIYSEGVMFVGAASYYSSFEYRPGVTDFTLCPAPAPGALLVRCSTINVDRPYLRDEFSLSGELRTQFNNVPVLKVLGFAPRLTWRLSDDRKQIDVPIYLSATGIFGSAGFRVRHTWDGLDLLGNRDDAKTELSVFVSQSLNFRGY